MNRILVYCIIFLASFTQPATCAEISKWQKYLDEGKKAISANDPSYALYKLRLAWNSVPEKKNSQAYQKIRTVLLQALEQSGESTDDSIENLDHRIKQREHNSALGGFAVELAKDGTLNFFADESLYSPTAGYCATGSVQSTELAKAKQADSAKEQVDRQNQILAKMPIKIKPGTDKYRNLLSLCGPIKAGERKDVEFDLNPFLPKEFQTGEDL